MKLGERIPVFGKKEAVFQEKRAAFQEREAVFREKKKQLLVKALSFRESGNVQYIVSDISDRICGGILRSGDQSGMLPLFCKQAL